MGEGGAQLVGDGNGRAILVFLDGIQRGLMRIEIGVQTDVEVGVRIFDGGESRDDGSVGVVDLHCQYYAYQRRNKKTYRPHGQHKSQRSQGTQGQKPARHLDVLVMVGGVGEVLRGHLHASTDEGMHGVSIVEKSVVK